MPRQKSAREAPKKLKQTKLIVGGAKTKATPKLKLAAKRKYSSSSGEENAHSDDSGVAAIRLEPKKEDDDDEQIPSPTKRRRRTIVIGSDEDSDEVIPVVKSPPRTRKSKGKEQEEKSKEKEKKDTTQAKKKKKGKEPVKGKGKGNIPKPVPSDSDAEPSPSHRRRKLVKGTRPTPKTDSESDEVDQEHIIQQRFRSRDKKTAFQKNLEKLKQKKQGKHVEEEEEEDPEWYYVEEAVPFKGAAPDGDESENSLFDERESDGSEGFIVDDNGEGLASLPAEFSMEAHEDLAHQFKKIFQFFVHIAVHPPVERHDFMERLMKSEEYFAVPLTIARRKISGLRDSLVASSVWRPDFKGPLEKYPELDLIQLDFAIPGCDACHLGARMSTLTGRLLGEHYDRLGFQDLDVSDDEQEGGGPRAEFHLGRFCARRTRVYHDLSHWEYTLFKTISEEVDDLHISEQSRGGGFVRVAWAGGIKPPEDLQDADGICDWLDQRKIIEMEWGKLKDYMERARGLELDRKKGDDID